jgi:hypothetical protein
MLPGMRWEAAGHGDASASLDGDPGLFLRFRDAALRRKAGREQKRDRDGVAKLHEWPPRSVQPAGCLVLADPQFRVGLQKQIDLVRREGRAPELELADGLEPIEHKSRAQVLIRHQPTNDIFDVLLRHREPPFNRM